MLCPFCKFRHDGETGRLLALAPLYGVETNGASFIHRKAWTERWKRLERGNLLKCLNCGNDFGLDASGPFVPILQPVAAQRREIPPATAKPETEVRPAHLPDDDLADVPEFK